MKEIDRYSLEEDDLAPNEHGPWVKHSDYAEDRKVLMDALKKYEDVRDGYGNYSARALLAGRRRRKMLRDRVCAATEDKREGASRT